ncbi:AAA family ATPase [Candidatus Saccharibacteria bacterium]|nr:AAA family ATPase [Candidatus Saccharibacteria bacterium]
MRQKQALTVMMSGKNVFLTGPPGAGKTYVLNEFIRRAKAKGKRIAVTASTGIAATHIGGTTIHSWSGLGIRDELTAHDERWLTDNEKLTKRYNATDILVIDEVSMLHGARLDMINKAAKLLRLNDLPYGGMQVILVGDFFQLPPISRDNSLVDFVYTSAAWEELDMSICYITEQHRQAESDGLLELLEAMRSGDITDEHRRLLGGRMQKTVPSDVTVTRLYAHNIDVDAINQRHLKALTTKIKSSQMQFKGNKQRIESLVKSVLAPELLELKVGAEVMFVANNFAEGFANGSRGQVIDFRGDQPVVRLMSGRIIHVEPYSWNFSEDGKVKAEVAQLPLRLAWAITIHKSQGMSLDAAEIDLSKAFTPGMGYVALSRVRSLDGLYLQGVNRTAFSMHPEIHEFDRRIRIDSAGLSVKTEDILDEVVAPSKTAGSPTIDIDDELFDALKTWRLARAAADAVAPFMIAHNSALTAIAANPPSTSSQLLSLPGFGKAKVESYGDDILRVVAKHMADISPAAKR